MSASVKIELGDLLASLGALEQKGILAVEQAVTASIYRSIYDAVKNRMTNQQLGVVTGTARRSIAGVAPGTKAPPSDASMRSAAAQHTTRSDIRVVGEFGSALDYVRVHEEGFSGVVQVPAYTRKIVALVRNPSGKITKKSAREYKRAIVAGRKTYALVRAHGRKVNIRAKHFLRDALAQETPKIGPRIERALLIVAKTGRVPDLNELVR